MHDLTTLRIKNPDKNPLIFWTKQQVYAWVNKRVARKSFRVITPTEFVKRDVATFTGVPEDKITVTYESADAIQDPAEPFTGLDGKPFIMYIGRPTPHKNLWRLVEAFKYLQKQHPELRLVLAGKTDNNYQQIADRAKAEQITNIIFTDFISEGQLRWLYEHTTAYIYPSLSEGFGLPGLEAMIHHAPVVSSNATCLPEVYGEAAIYFNPLDVGDMAQKINDVISDKVLAKQLVAKGSAQVAKYSWQRMAEQTLAIYREALGE
jgi:glycosyltransferase involved in cell wall biosynthesis